MTAHPEIHHLAKETRIERIAYAIWEEEGRPEGRHLEHWLRASELVEAEAAGGSTPDWLQRAAAGDEVAPATPPEASVPPSEKEKSLDAMVKRMKSSQAA